MNEHLRQTGRTERMIAHAKSLCAQGRAVYIFTDGPSIRRLQRELHDTQWRSIKIEDMPHDFDWSTMRPGSSRAHTNCVFLVEHHLIEQELERIDKHIMHMTQLARQLYALTT